MSSRRIRRSFAFIDLCGFIQYMDRHGDTAALEVLTELRAITRRAAEQYGVRIAKWLGDGALIVGLDEESVLACVREILEASAHTLPLAVRGGIGSGPALLIDGDDYVGTAINVAARLCAAAPPGQMLVADSDEPAEGSTRQIRVHGLAKPIAVHALDPVHGPR